MTINGKSLMTKKELIGQTKVCPNVEIQLYHEFDNYKSNINKMIEIAKEQNNLNITSIHSPLGKKSLNVEYLNDPLMRFKFQQSVLLAHECAKLYKQNINVVVHTISSFDFYNMCPILFNLVAEEIKWAIETFDDINICIENTTPICSPDELIFKNGLFFDNVYLVRALRDKLNTDRIYTVLDTCHAMTSLKVLDNIFRDEQDLKPQITLEDIIKENKDVLKIIHLSDVEGLGFRKKQHGILFKENRLDEMNYILSLYKKYDLDADITLEIIEDDYEKNENFHYMYPKVLEFFNKK